MFDPLADTTARLERLVEQAMKETDPDKSDELCAEIWRVLRERDEVKKGAACCKPGWLTLTGVSYNAGVVKYFFPTLLHPLRDERHFALVEISAIPTKARS
jgi:hypothetical protein